MVPEGTSLRYSAIAALGLGRCPVEAQHAVLGGQDAAELARACLASVRDSSDTGAVALSVWAAGEVAGVGDGTLVARLLDALRGESITTVECAWIVLAGLASPSPASGTLAAEAVALLLAHQAPADVFPHDLPRSGGPRGHVSCFADQIYPIQALARFAARTGDERALAEADAAAEWLVERQGPSGQWWWHYDARTGDVVERYPVYSVHQHGMAPMALSELAAAGGHNHGGAVRWGRHWLDAHPECVEPLVAPELGVVWRKVGRQEPLKTVARRCRARESCPPRGAAARRRSPVAPRTGRPRVPPLRTRLAALRIGRPGHPRRCRMTEVRQILGYPLVAATMAEVVGLCAQAIDSREQLQIGVLNAAKIVNARRDDALQDAIRSCSILLADGQSVVWASRLLRRPLPERVTGIDLFLELLSLADRQHRSVFLLGGTDAVNDRVVEVMRSRYPGARIAGHRDGYFTDADAVAHDIASSAPDMLFVAMGSPGKEIFLQRYQAFTRVPVTARRRRILRRSRRGHQESAAGVAVAGNGVGVPAPAGAGAAVEAVPAHERAVRRPGRTGHRGGEPGPVPSCATD